MYNLTLEQQILTLQKKNEELERGRTSILSYLSWIIGGWNASPGFSAGRLSAEPSYNNDEQICRFLLDSYKNYVTKSFRDEIKDLKSAGFDLVNERDSLKKENENYKIRLRALGAIV